MADPYTKSEVSRVPALSCDVVSVILRLAVLVGLRLVTDGQTVGQTDGHRAMASTADAEHRSVMKAFMLGMTP